MTDKPFVTIKHAGNAKINDNDTGGQRLADIDRVDGDLEILRNTSGGKSETAAAKTHIIVRILHSPIIASVVAGLILAVILAVVGLSS